MVGAAAAAVRRRVATDLPCDALFLALAPAWARRPFSSSSTQLKGSRHRRVERPADEDYYVDLHSRSRSRSDSNPASSSKTLYRTQAASAPAPSASATRKAKRGAAAAGPKFVDIPTVKLNNYLLALARTHRTPPPAYIFESIRLLRDVFLTQFKQHSESRAPTKARIGPDRMSFEIMLDILARAIPLHTDLNRELSKAKRKPVLLESATHSPSSEQPPEAAEDKPAPLPKYNASSRVPGFYEYACHPTHQDHQRPPHHHIPPRTFIANLNNFLNNPLYGSFKIRVHFFPQDKQTIEAVADADELAFPKTPTRPGKNPLAHLDDDDPDAPDGPGEHSSHPQEEDHNTDIAMPGSVDPRNVQRQKRPKTPAQIYLSIFSLVYRAMLSRYPDRPFRRFLDSSTTSDTDGPQHSPQFARKGEHLPSLVSSGGLGPGGPSVYAYAARIMCFQRVREWDEVRATVRECLSRAWWEPPVIAPIEGKHPAPVEPAPHSRVVEKEEEEQEGREEDDEDVRWGFRQPVKKRSEPVPLPAGWTAAGIDSVLEDTHNKERSMFNSILLTQVLWAWVRVQAPSAPYTAPAEDWLEGGDYEPAAQAAATTKASGGGNSQLQADLQLPSIELKEDGQAAVNETVQRLRDVYDLVRDNAMLQEWERLSQIEESEGRRGKSSGGNLIAGALSWISFPSDRDGDGGGGGGGAVSAPFLELERQDENHLPSLDRELGQIARKGRTWSKDKVWLEQMRALLRWDDKQMTKVRMRRSMGVQQASSVRWRGRLPSPPKPPRKPRRSNVVDDHVDADDEDADEEFVYGQQHRSKKLPTKRHEQTLRKIFGIPTHPAITPRLPPHVVPDEVMYTQFIRLFSHLGDWKQAVEVLADYEQTPISPTSTSTSAAEGDGAGEGEEEGVGEFVRAAAGHRVVNEVTLPMFDALFRGYSLHGLPPQPSTVANITSELVTIRRKVFAVLRRLGLEEDESLGRPANALDVSELLSHVRARGRGWSLESLVFLFEAFMRVRPDCGTDSVRRRGKAREAAYQREVAARRAASWREREGQGYGMAGGGVEAYQFEGASPTPPSSSAESQRREFFDRNVLQQTSTDHPPPQRTAPGNRGVANDGDGKGVGDDAADLEWMGPIGRNVLDNVYGPVTSENQASRLEKRIPDRIFGRPALSSSSTLEVDEQGQARALHPAPVPRQLFWVLTALRRVTADQAPGWVLGQWARMLNKFGPDELVVQEEVRRREERRRRRMHLRPEVADAAEEAEDLKEREGEKEGGAGANGEGWYAWKFPQRRTNRIITYLGLRAGIPEEAMRPRS
ncbi:unnamed protein product [Tilletia controversa]|nr:hypothetical protein CF328_g3538 [Tilletia controversa]CAD6901280.1 unnamed protein product [Tilletia controversa]